jgi:hypothetical protein
LWVILLHAGFVRIREVRIFVAAQFPLLSPFLSPRTHASASLPNRCRQPLLNMLDFRPPIWHTRQMTHSLKSTLTLLAFLACSTLTGFSKDKAGETAAAPKPDDIRLVKIATLNTVEANQEFQRNVQIMQAARAELIRLKTAVDAEKDAAKKKDLEKQLDDKLKELNDNNQKMVKAYGFSLTRDYVLVVETAHIYMQVSPEEAATYEKELEKQKAPAKK